jgi:hypothetical protein
VTARHRRSTGAHRARRGLTRFLEALDSVGALEEDSSLGSDIPQSVSPAWGRPALYGAQEAGWFPAQPASALLEECETPDPCDQVGGTSAVTIVAARGFGAVESADFAPRPARLHVPGVA